MQTSRVPHLSQMGQMGGGLRRWGLVAASVALPWFARDARASFRRPPPWAAKVPPGVCYHHVASGGREMTVFLRSEDASENASECRMRGDGGSGGAPVVVALHGFGGGAPDMFIPLSEGVARGAGLALAVPRGVNGSLAVLLPARRGPVARERGFESGSSAAACASRRRASSPPAR